VGDISGIEITQVFLLGISVYIAIASVMVFLSLVLGPAVGRWANIVLPILYVLIIVASAIWRDVGVPHLSERRRDRAAAVDHLVRVEVASTGSRLSGPKEAVDLTLNAWGSASPPAL
jgi:predicted membrane channel-forming protein YqfA (hemolysin III family)